PSDPEGRPLDVARQSVAHRQHGLRGRGGPVANAEAQLKERRSREQPLADQLPGELDVPELEDLDLRAHAARAVLRGDIAQIAGRGAVQRLVEVERSAVEAADLRTQLEDVRDALAG